jgi:hypothetical protein
MVVELLEGQIDAAAANGVRWGTRYVLVVALSYFPELKSKLELLGFRCNADLTEDQANALLSRVRAASDSLASHVSPLVACSPPDGTGE